jgi:hypothetical protein
MYSINPKTGSWIKLLGPIRGLGAKMSKDGKYIAYSKPANKSTSLNIYNISKSTTTETYLDTLVDKCVWGNFYKDLIYCAVPFEVTSATYPDEWYKGKVGSADKIWQLNASTGESKLVEKLIGNAGRIIDGWNLGLDDKDNFLFFVNKWDLSLWSLDLEKTGN